MHVELRKVREHYTAIDETVLSDEAIAWAYLLTNGFAEEQEVEQIMNAFPDIATFARQYGLAVDDPEVVRAYEAAASAEQEYDSRRRHWERVKREAIEEGRNEGRREGREEGIRQGALEERERMIAVLREQGVDESIIEACVSTTVTDADE